MRRRRQEDHHRAFDAVLVRNMLPVTGSLPVEAIVSSPSRLQQLQRMKPAALRASLHDGKHLVLEIFSPM